MYAMYEGKSYQWNIEATSNFLKHLRVTAVHICCTQLLVDWLVCSLLAAKQDGNVDVYLFGHHPRYSNLIKSISQETMSINTMFLCISPTWRYAYASNSSVNPGDLMKLTNENTQVLPEPNLT